MLLVWLLFGGVVVVDVVVVVVVIRWLLLFGSGWIWVGLSLLFDSVLLIYTS